MPYLSEHDMKFDLDYTAIPYFCILLSVFIYMCCECYNKERSTHNRRELYSRV